LSARSGPCRLQRYRAFPNRHAKQLGQDDIAQVREGIIVASEMVRWNIAEVVSASAAKASGIA
jgi:hypothetical protein